MRARARLRRWGQAWAAFFAGPRFARAVARNMQAAHALDAAVREVLQQ